MMSDVVTSKTPAQPLKRIVRPTPVARQRKMTIGRIAANSQLMANSFGRSTSIRRSMSHDSSVRFPTWLLPALPARADDLDPYRDRDLIALRQSRMKNRVVRQVQPRGLPMAAHAHGRSRSGIQTGPSSIARRLHPIRRQPNKNDAHLGPSSMPFVRVASQPQRPTARPPRTRSSNTPARNGNRTDRDGPASHPAAREARAEKNSSTGTTRHSTSETVQSASSSSIVRRKESRVPHIVQSEPTMLQEPTRFLQQSPRFESVMVARSLLSTTPGNPEPASATRSSDATTMPHRLSLPRVSSRQSIDRSTIHRRPLSTIRKPVFAPNTRIPLSMMFEPPRRLQTNNAAASNSVSRSPSLSRMQNPVPQNRTPSNAKQSTQPSFTSSQNPTSQSTTSSTRTNNTSPASEPRSAGTATSTETNTTSQKAISVAGSSPAANANTPEWTSFPSRATSSTDISRRAVTPTTSEAMTSPSAVNANVQTDSAPITTMPEDISSSRVEEQITTQQKQSLRRRVRKVSVPRTAGWRQVVGLPLKPESTEAPSLSTSSQDSLFRRVAALANPTGAPLGTPGDIARRAPVSGSLISIASSMHAAVRSNREMSNPSSSLDRSTRSALPQRINRNVNSSPASAQSSPRPQAVRATSAVSKSQVATVSRVTNSGNTARSDNSNKVVNRQTTSPLKGRSTRSTHQQSSSPMLMPPAKAAKLARSLQGQSGHTSTNSNHQQPTFANLWSSVNHSTSRQSNLIARRSLRLPQTRIHSFSSKPGTILRQQFGITAPVSNTGFDRSDRSIIQGLAQQKNHRSHHALRIGAQRNSSTDRVLSVARKTRSQMSSITPGASGGIQFAGSLAKAVSHRQTHGTIDQTRSSNQQTRLTSGSTARSASTASVQRSTTGSSATTTRASSTSRLSSSSAPLTGSGAHVAQNFLDRLSRKTGEDFTPAMTIAQEASPVSTSDESVIARSQSSSPQINRSAETSSLVSKQSDISSGVASSEDEPHWAIMRSADESSHIDNDSLMSQAPRASDASERASRAMTEPASVSNGSVLRSVVSRQIADRSTNHSEQSDQTTDGSAPTTRDSSSTRISASTPSQSSRTARPTTISQVASTQVPKPTSTRSDSLRTRQEIVERGGSIASRGVLHRAVSRSVPTQRLSSPLNDLPVSPNVSPGMRIPSEAFSASPAVPGVARGMASPAISPETISQSTSSDVSRSTNGSATVVSRSVSNSPSRSVRRDGHRSVSIRRQTSGVQFGPSEDGTISADALVRMIESGQSIPNRVVHRQVSGTTSSGIMRRPASVDRISRTSSTTIQRSTSLAEKAAPGPVSILSQVLAPSSDSETGTSQITTSQLLDLMDWINRIVDDRLRQELERRGVAGGRW